MAASPSSTLMYPQPSTSTCSGTAAGGNFAAKRSASTPRRRGTSAPAQPPASTAHKPTAGARNSQQPPHPRSSLASKGARRVSPGPAPDRQHENHADVKVSASLQEEVADESHGQAAAAREKFADIRLTSQSGASPAQLHGPEQQPCKEGDNIDTVSITNTTTSKGSNTRQGKDSESAQDGDGDGDGVGDGVTARWVAQAEAAELQAAAAAAAAAEALARAPPPPVRTRRGVPGGPPSPLASPAGGYCSDTWSSVLLTCTTSDVSLTLKHRLYMVALQKQ
jgi:hypothetical protein